MIDWEIKKKFRRSVLCKQIGILIMLLGAVPLAIEEFSMPVSINVVVMIIGFYVMHQYKCPYCNHSFDSRIWSSKIKYCENCGKKINEGR